MNIDVTSAGLFQNFWSELDPKVALYHANSVEVLNWKK
jgi:hypothetical protein